MLITVRTFTVKPLSWSNVYLQYKHRLAVAVHKNELLQDKAPTKKGTTCVPLLNDGSSNRFDLFLIRYRIGKLTHPANSGFQ